MARNRRPGGLPDFDNPPLVEVVLLVQFEALAPIEFIEALGTLWLTLRNRFPNVEQQPPMSPVFEIFGVPSAPAWPSIRFARVPDLPRFWAVNQPGTELLQFQADRFAHNWRKLAVDDVYPRYEQIRHTFMIELGR